MTQTFQINGLMHECLYGKKYFLNNFPIIGPRHSHLIPNYIATL